MDLVDVIVDALVHSLDTPCDQDLPVELVRIMFAGKSLYLPDQITRLMLADEL